MENIGEQLKTLRNLSEISLILYNLSKTELLPTILEVIYLQLQEMMEYCLADK